MKLDDFDAAGIDVTRDEFKRRLSTVRHDGHGSFILYVSESGPQVWISVNADLAYIHYFDDDSCTHPGYQSDRSGDPDMPRMVIDFHRQARRRSLFHATSLCSVIDRRHICGS